MKLNEAKQACSEAIRKSRKNGDRVEEIMREADEVESQVQKRIQRFTRRLERYWTKIVERANGANNDASVGDNPTTEPGTAEEKGDE